MKHVVLLPERWQLGDVISVKVRRVPSIKADRLTVCCAPNQRFLYPTATDFVDVAENLDGFGAHKVKEELYMQYPEAEQIKMSRVFPEDLDLRIKVPEVEAGSTDALIAPRWKDSSHPHRNWDGWGSFYSEMMNLPGNKGVIGYEAKNCHWDSAFKIWDIESIAAHMLKTKLVVATDSGMAHLAILLRVPLAVIWGTPVGVIPGQTYEQGCHKRMEHQKRSPVWHIEGGWEDPGKAFHMVRDILCTL